MNILSATLLLILVCCVFSASRRGAVLGMITGALFLSQGAMVQILDFNFFPTRILGICCFMRIMARGEFSMEQVTRTDKILFLLYAFTTFVLFLRDPARAPLWSARMMDVVLIYTSFRALIRSPDDWEWLVGRLALVLVPYAGILTVESLTGYNLFERVGATDPVWMRDDTVRCCGSFRHPSILGSLGACFIPLYIGLLWDPDRRKTAILGTSLCLAIVYYSYSGGPLGVLCIAVVGWLIWPLRRNMPLLRLGLFSVIFMLALLMKAPVWYLLSRISGLTGGTGWHRAYLIEVALDHLDQWWLAGMSDDDTAGWFPYVLEATNGADITNQFISFGIRAGLLAIIILIALIYQAFSLAGKALARIRESSLERSEPLLWALGVALAAHVSNWLGISYFDQFNVLWLLQLAALVSLSSFYLQATGTPLPAAGEDLETDVMNWKSRAET